MRHQFKPLSALRRHTSRDDARGCKARVRGPAVLSTPICFQRLGRQKLSLCNCLAATLHRDLILSRDVKHRVSKQNPGCTPFVRLAERAYDISEHIHGKPRKKNGLGFIFIFFKLFRIEPFQRLTRTPGRFSEMLAAKTTCIVRSLFERITAPKFKRALRQVQGGRFTAIIL